MRRLSWAGTVSLDLDTAGVWVGAEFSCGIVIGGARSETTRMRHDLDLDRGDTGAIRRYEAPQTFRANA
jgi:hypothetical protein